MTARMQIPDMKRMAILAGKKQFPIHAVFHHGGSAPFARDHGVVTEVPPEIIREILRAAVDFPWSQAETASGGAVAGEANSEGRGRGKLLSPERRRGAVRHVREAYRISERHACRLLGQWRGTQRYEVLYRSDEDALTRAIIELASEYGRYGYRRITVKLRDAGWQVGKDRVQRIWRREGLKVPQRQRPRGRLWFNDGSCVRLRPLRANHVWSYDFVKAMTHDGRTLRLLVLIDEYTSPDIGRG